MLPQSHVFIALGVVRALSHRFHELRSADYRKVAVAAVLPDLIDKPLAMFAFPNLKAGLLFAHAPILHLPWWLLAWRRKEWRAYALAFTSHLLGDRIWFFGDTFWFPLRGFRFHQWQQIGDPRSFGKAYRDLFAQRPSLILYELGALLVLVWFIASSRLNGRSAVWKFVASGKLPLP